MLTEVVSSTVDCSTGWGSATVHRAPFFTPATSAGGIMQRRDVHSGPLRLVPDDFFPLHSCVNTPINVDFLQKILVNHPNRELVNFIISGFTFGFRLGVQNSNFISSSKNNKSSYDHADKVDEAILKELNRGHTIGPFDHPPLANFHCSPLGAAPKKDGTIRVILDLSSPLGYSVNDAIDRDDYSVSYSSFDDAVNLVRKLGPNCFMAKLDIKHAFRLCPVHPDDWHLLGYKWGERFYFDVVLPFGGRSSPFIFNTFADLLQWILVIIFLIINLLHYLDDFFTAERLIHDCLGNIDLIKDVFSQLGVPLAPDKLVGPSQVLTYLGIEIDSVNSQIRLPTNKLSELLSSLSVWKDRKKCTKKELLSLIGGLSFACKVVKCGRIFLRRLIDLSTTVHRLHHHISINSEARKDIQWWVEFLPSWNGIELFQDEFVSSDDIELFTDASGFGLGGYFNGQWFSIPFNNTNSYSIGFLELLAIVITVFCWGDSWHNKQITLFTDNESIVHVWSTGSCKSANIMTLVRLLFFFTAKRNINLMLRHIPGVAQYLC